MKAARVDEILAGLALFRALPPEQLAALAPLCRRRMLRAGESVFRQGERARAFYAVAGGAVRVYRSSPDGREQLVHHLRPGQSFGEPALFGAGLYPAHAAAASAGAELVEIEGAGFLARFRAEPALAAAIVASLCARLLELVDRVEELSVGAAETRLARYLLRLPTRGNKGVLELELPMAKKELALQLAITPETLSRQLARWRAQRWIEVAGRRIALRRPEALLAIADGEVDQTRRSARRAPVG